MTATAITRTPCEKYLAFSMKYAVTMMNAEVGSTETRDPSKHRREKTIRRKTKVRTMENENSGQRKMKQNRFCLSELIKGTNQTENKVLQSLANIKTRHFDKWG